VGARGALAGGAPPRLRDAHRLAAITVSYELPKHLSAHGDPGRLRQVLGNLLRNAVEAMPSGGTLSLRATKASRDKHVAIEIVDTGAGIERTNLARVFEPFFTTKKGGTGLGLSISYGIVRALGGELRVASTPGEGSRFTLELPADAEGA
jgi:two-component system NtrC family sensor kinase